MGKRYWIGIIAALLVIAVVIGVPAVLLSGNTVASTKSKPTIDTTKIHKVPDSYSKTPAKAGKLVKITYTSRTYDSNNTEVTKHAMVYLPYGYDKNKKYDIVYLMHGYGGSYDTFLGSSSNPRYLKSMLDNMIARVDIKPTIVVTPTLTWGNEGYYDTMDNFQKELINDLMPTVESSYSTYAKSTTDKGFKASRSHRAMAGFSMGGCITWQTLRDNTRYFKYYLPMSCPLYYYDDSNGGDQTADMAKQIDNGVASSGYTKSQYFVFAATGSKDYVRHELINQVKHLKQYSGEFKSTDTDFSKGNLMLYVAKGHHHSFKQSYVYIYNGLIRFFK